MLNYLSKCFNRSQPALGVTDCLDCAFTGEPDDILCAETDFWCPLISQKLMALTVFQPGCQKKLLYIYFHLWQESFYQNGIQNIVLILFQSLIDFCPISFNLLEKHFHYIIAEICLQPSNLPIQSGDSKAEKQLLISSNLLLVSNVGLWERCVCAVPLITSYTAWKLLTQSLTMYSCKSCKDLTIVYSPLLGGC